MNNKICSWLKGKLIAINNVCRTKRVIYKVIVIAVL